ncbi:MAG: hypothetical protein GY711_01470 [bacterium]|nr:hypothetical protein [bacterium]
MSHSRFATIRRPVRRLVVSFGLAATCIAFASAAQQDVTFSIDWHGPTISMQSPAGAPITEGDLLFPPLGRPAFGPLPPPRTFLNGGQLGLSRYDLCSPHPPSQPCGVEVDALSFGDDFLLTGSAGEDYTVYFSVDEYATGDSGNPIVPSVTSEFATGDHGTDIFGSNMLPPAPTPPVLFNNVGVVDGDGLPSATLAATIYPGVGLIEGNIAGTGLPSNPDMGDNLDALNIGPRPDPLTGPVFFSVDGAFFDPLVMVPNSGTAQFENVRAGDVLVRIPGGQFQVYADSAQLGLDLMGPNTDDLDALVLVENGMPGYQRSVIPYDWLAGFTGVPSDMLLFSVRRGSALIGMVDSLLGLQIVEGDVLVPPVGGATTPGIFITAESLGLVADRGGTSSDDLNAGDVTGDKITDCNNNGIEDWVDINTGFSCDVNGNSIPDECEPKGTSFCQCTAANAPCGNGNANAGCENSTGAGAELTGDGTSSVFSDDIVLRVTDLPSNQFGIFFMGQGTTSAPLADGYRCVDSSPAFPLFRFQQQVFNTGAAGTAEFGEGTALGPIIDASCTTLGAGGCIELGQTWYFQAWYRDPVGGPCGNGGTHSNLTNGWMVTFTL